MTASQRQLKLGFSLQVPTETLEAERQARKEVVRLHSSILLLAASAQAAPEIGEAMAAISHTLLPNLFNRTKEWLHCKFQCRYAALQLQKTHPGICFLQSNPWNWTFHLRSLGELILRRLRDKKQTLEAKHIKGSFNVLSDQLSRNTTISTEWSLPQTTFNREIQRKFPSLKWDMFATSLNRKLPKFVSRPGSDGHRRSHSGLVSYGGTIPVPSHSPTVEGGGEVARFETQDNDSSHGFLASQALVCQTPTNQQSSLQDLGTPSASSGIHDGFFFIPTQTTS